MLQSKSHNAYRLIHGAGDGFKGFYLDRFGEYLLASKGGSPSDPEKKLTLEWMSQLGCRGAYFKQLNRQVRKENITTTSPRIWLGDQGPSETRIVENDLHYQIRFDEGYSVGIFLDQRENRKRWLQLRVGDQLKLETQTPSSGEILNTFSYTCPFSVCVAKAGLRAVSLDLSRKYLEWGRENFQLNELDPDEHDFIYGDVFDWMRRFRKRGRKFSGIILDPPTFSKASKNKKMFQAEKDYPELLKSALDIIEPGGLILACNNTAGWSPRSFESVILQTLRKNNINPNGIQFCPQPADFPVTMQTPQYLKSVWIKIDRMNSSSDLR